LVALELLVNKNSKTVKRLDDSLFIRALRGKSVERTPVWLMRQAGRYQASYRAIREKVDFLTLCHSSELAAQVTVEAVDSLQVDAGIIFADILLPLERIGRLSFARGDGPQLAKPVVCSQDVDSLPTIDVEGELSYVFQSVSLFCKERPQVPLIGFAGAPFTLASYLIEGGSSRNFEKTKAFMFKESAAFAKLMSYLTDVTIAYLKGQAEAGAHALMLFDSWVGALSRQDFQRFVLPHSKKIFAALEEQPTIYFGTACGGMLDLFAESGAACIGVDWRSDLSNAHRMIGQDKAYMGNLDPCVLFADKDEIARQAAYILDQAKAAGGSHIFNLGHGILQHTQEENVRFLVETVKEYSADRKT